MGRVDQYLGRVWGFKTLTLFWYDKKFPNYKPTAKDNTVNFIPLFRTKDKKIYFKAIYWQLQTHVIVIASLGVQTNFLSLANQIHGQSCRLTYSREIISPFGGTSMFEQLRFSNFSGIFLDRPFPLSWSLEQATFLLNTSPKSFPHALIDMTRLIF